MAAALACLAVVGSAVRAFRFVAPLVDDGYPPAVAMDAGEMARRPLLLYLPGFDGTPIAPFLQFPSLGEDFHVQALSVGMEDRSTFDDLVDSVVEHLDACVPPSRQVVVMGESFGGMLALEVALRREARDAPLAGLVLVNPATSYLESTLAARAPAVAALPSALYPFGVLSLLPLFVDRHQLPSLGLMVSGAKLPAVIDTPAREAYMGRVALTLPRRLTFMPRTTLRWRLGAWLEEGARRHRAHPARLQQLTRTRTCIVAGDADRTLPSAEEAERLAALLPDAAVTVVPGAGHAATCGSRVHLAQLLCRRLRLRPGEDADAEAPARDAQAWTADARSAEYGLVDRPHPVVQPWQYWRRPDLWQGPP